METYDDSNESSYYDAIETRKNRISFIWILPMVALVMGGWLIYKNFIEKDLLLRIHFNSGAGIVAGKTKLNDRDTMSDKLDKLLEDNEISRGFNKSKTGFIIKRYYGKA